jgi:hypothetical protein
MALLAALFCVAGVAPFVRVVIHCDGYAPPISFLGRLATGRWIIPCYDQVFAAPLLAAATGYALGTLSAYLGLDPLFSHPVVVAVVLFICLGLGPSLTDWRLTGEHRLVEGSLRSGAVKVG